MIIYATVTLYSEISMERWQLSQERAAYCAACLHAPSPSAALRWHCWISMKRRQKKNAEEINSEGFTAKGYACNVLEKASCEAAREQIRLDFGTCDILLNGAGGNNPRATTDKEYYEPGDISREDIKTFFNLDPAGVEFVFNLNFLGTLIPTQVFAPDMLGKEDVHPEYFINERLYAADQNSRLFGRQGCNQQFHTVACRTFRRLRHPGQRNSSRLPGFQPKPCASLP